jgi:2-aminoadipate transaminase
MIVELDRSRGQPLYLQISRQIRERIQSGELIPGTRLPPERRLAVMLGVNRSTVVNAYRELAAEGYVEGRVGHGTVVTGLLESRAMSAGRASIPWDQLMTVGGQDLDDPLLRDAMLISARPGVISFASGVPSPDLFPVELIRDLLDEALHDVGNTLLQHCPVQGYPALRAALVDWLSPAAQSIDPSNVLIVAGSQQGLYLLARTLVEPGDLVAIESPTYLGALQVFRTAGARLLPIPVDQDGMQVELLEDLIERRRPKLIYTLPTFQNPSSTTMSLERRRRLLTLAARHQIPVVEDDPYGALRYDGDPVPSLYALDEDGTVVYLSTVSKMLFPGFRIGWLSGPRPIIERLTAMKQIVDLDTNPLSQWAVWAFLARGLLTSHLERLRREDPRRRDRMLEALEHHCASALAWCRPSGGLYVWCRLTHDLRARDVLPEAARRGVTFAPGTSFHPDGEGEETLRLNFTMADGDTIDEGIARLAAAIAAAQRDSVRISIAREDDRVAPIV